jgi:hypothetical protein
MPHDHSVPDRMCREAVAYDLMRDILFDDPKRPPPSTPEFRAYVLDLFAECLAAVKGQRPRGDSRAEPAAVAPVPPPERTAMAAAFERGRVAKRRPALAAAEA